MKKSSFRESSSELTPEFAQFARDFKKYIKSILPIGAELVNFNRGHFEVFGFIKRGNSFIYFSTSDVRHFQDNWYNNILVRTAKNEKDYTGGCNNNVNLAGFKEVANKLLQ